MKITAKTGSVLVAMILAAIMFVPFPVKASTSDTEVKGSIASDEKATGSTASDEFSVKMFTMSTFDYVTRTGKYEGEIENGLPNGKGTFFLQNSEGLNYTATGTFKDGVPNGKMTMEFDLTGQDDLTAIETVENYKNGVIKDFYQKLENDKEWTTTYGIKSGNGYFVMSSTHTGFKSTFHVDENGEMYTDPFDCMYLDNLFDPYQAETRLNRLDLNDGVVLTTQKMRAASKSKLKKKAVSVPGETLLNDSEKYEGKLIRLENAVLYNGAIFVDGENNPVYIRYDFKVDDQAYTLYGNPEDLKYRFGKVRDLYFVSYGVTEFVNSDGTYEPRITGWIVRKANKSSQTETTQTVYRFSSHNYETFAGTFSGPLKDGKPNGFGVFSYKVNDQKVLLIGKFYAEQPLNGRYLGGTKDGIEQLNFLYEDGALVEGTATKEVKTGEEDGTGELWKYEIAHVTEGVLSQMTFCNSELSYISHINEKTGEEYKDPIDVYFETMIYNAKKVTDLSVAMPRFINMYFTTDSIRQLSNKEIKKKASETSVERIFADTLAFGEDVIKLENMKVVASELFEYDEEGGLTQIIAEVDGTEFSMFVDSKKNSYREGDKINAYITPSICINIGTEEEPDYKVLSYAYIIKKAK